MEIERSLVCQPASIPSRMFSKPNSHFNSAHRSKPGNKGETVQGSLNASDGGAVENWCHCSCQGFLERAIEPLVPQKRPSAVKFRARSSTTALFLGSDSRASANPHVYYLSLIHI
eukprot:3744408-Amphidinium_carterae.1